MLRAPIPDDEEQRLALLQACNIIYTPAEAAFDDVARLAADICGTEIALITLVDAEQQWFKARVGVTQTSTPRDLSFCGHCIHDRHALVVEDTHADSRFADNPLVTGDPHLRFYAGVPLLVEEGSAIGALSVADRSPRRLSDRQLSSLYRLAAQISRELGLRRDLEKVRATLRPRTSALSVGPGSVIDGRWKIERLLGRGAVGAVYEASDAAGERVALKVLLPEWRMQEQVLERFAREARVLMRLTTPHVGRLLDVGNLDAAAGDLPFLVLEYLQGMDLEHVVTNVGRVPYKKACGWCADACKGVAEAHDLGVVHRDLKPSNIFLARTSQAAGQVKVLDFGIAAGEPARATGTQLTAVEMLLGTPAYMSPEQMIASSEVDARSDIWSMGVLLYQLITGKLPFPGATNLELFAATMTRPPVPLESHLVERLPEPVEAILYTCLKKDRNERYPSMQALSGALASAAAA
jgi:tRNA A-37 threonylcarbamoyl transferase component Bud32